jgi:citrate lyase subunit beta/citryl-CoA lyase
MRSKLFVPASRPELFDKALGGAADAISFDLEDAVAIERKGAARDNLKRLLVQDLAPSSMVRTREADKTLIVRVNACGTPHFEQDLDAVVWPALHIINLPMVESANEVRQAVAAIEVLERERAIARPLGILANIESPRGLRRAAEIALAHPRVIGLQIGYGDLFAPLGISAGEPAATQYVRIAVRMAAGEAGVDAFDGAYVDYSDPAGYRRDSEAARQLGFAGRSCIHPSQVALANEVFRPSEAEIAHALKVVEAATEHLGRGVGAFTVEGRLVDGPFITRAEHLVALARRLGII